MILLVAKDDRAVRIEVGYGLEGALPDAIAKRIIEEMIVPRFREGDFYGGISEGVERIIGVIEGEPLPPPRPSRGVGGLPDENALWLIVPAPIAGRRARAARSTTAFSGASGRGRARGRARLVDHARARRSALGCGAVAAFFILAAGSGGRRRGGWSSGGWGGGYRAAAGSAAVAVGGGGSGGGGGGFGGGGASGRW